MNSKIARRYTLALYEECLKQNKVDNVSADLNTILGIISENRQLQLFFQSPVISKRKKVVIIKSLFKGKADNIVYNFILLLIERSRENMIADIISDFFEYRNIMESIVTAKITSAFELDNNRKKGIVKSLELYSGKKCIPEYELNRDLIGGFIIKYNDLVLNASIKRQLELLKIKFKESSFTKV